MGNTKALICGIDAYEPPNTLHGCVADARDFFSALTITGYAHSNIRLLLNQKATKQNILAGLKWLVDGTKAGDLRTFFYSGHGTNFPDQRGGDETGDRMDEAIVAQNIDWDDEANDYNCIRDDDMKKIFDTAAPGTIIDVVFDSCYSGTATRILEITKLSPNGKMMKQLRRRYMPAPIELRLKSHALVPSQTLKQKVGRSVLETAADASAKDLVHPEQKNALWSACLENQLSEEAEDENGQVRGFFTRVFAHIIRASNGNMSRLQMYQTARATMAGEEMDQVPDLEVPNKEALALFPFRKANRDQAAEVGHGV